MRFALNCEYLESRQLLSVGQSGLAAGMLANPSAVSAQIFIPATVSNFAPPSFFLIEIEFGTFGGLNQIQTTSFGSSPLFAPTPGSPLGALGGSSGNSSNSQTGLGLNVGTTTNPSITPLNPSATSITNVGGATVFVVPPPLAPLPVVHLGTSSVPATTQSNSTMISNIDEMPPMTRFGQGDVSVGPRLSLEKLDSTTQRFSLMDYVEPYRVIAPVAAPEAQPAQPGERAPVPDAANPRSLPAIINPEIDAALDLTDARVLTQSRDGDTAQPNDELSQSNTNTSWSLSAIFGAAAVATAGYHLVIREADRFRGRSIPRWVGAERPTRRKRGLPPR
jgi:hypothetical protein